MCKPLRTDPPGEEEMMGFKKETICVQGGWTPKTGEPRVLPIYQSTTFKYDTSDAMGALFDLEASGYFYTRLQNPTNDFVAKKICDLEGGFAAMLSAIWRSRMAFLRRTAARLS